MDTKIDFIIKDEIKKSFMQAQPKFSTVFSSERSYIVFISREFKLQNEVVKIDDMSFDVLVGWVGHELGHILDYKGRNVLSLLKFGIGYLFSRKYMIGAERVADMNAIEHGLSEHIIAVKNFILDHMHVPRKYKERIKRFYMAPEEVMLMAEKYA